MKNIESLRQIRQWLASGNQDSFLTTGLPIQNALEAVDEAIAALQPRTIQGCATSALSALSQAVGLPVRSTDELGRTLSLVISRSADILHESHGDKINEEVYRSSPRCGMSLSLLSELFKSLSDEYDITPFNLAEARENAPVKTRDGRKARIVCFDANSISERLDNIVAPLVVLVTQDDDTDLVLTYTEEGQCTDKRGGANADLIMV